MKNIHMILQGKGGVGKSLISSLICQYLNQHSEIVAIDSDPVNQTLAGYKALQAIQLEIRDGDNIDPRKFDKLMEIILDAPDDIQIVIDNGAATFMPLCAWMRENHIIEMWRDAGMRVFLHCVVTGGQAMNDTMDGLAALIDFFDAPIVVWLNRYFGEITQQDKQFEEFKIYQKNSNKIASIIRIPLKNPQTFGKDLEELFSRRQIFTEAIDDVNLQIMTRQRLKIFWNEVRAAMDSAQIFDPGK